MSSCLQEDAHDWYHAVKEVHGSRVARFLMRDLRHFPHFECLSDEQAKEFISEASKLYTMHPERVREIVRGSDRTVCAIVAGLAALACAAFFAYVGVQMAMDTEQLHVFAGRIILLGATIFAGGAVVKWTAKT